MSSTTDQLNGSQNEEIRELLAFRKLIDTELNTFKSTKMFRSISFPILDICHRDIIHECADAIGFPSLSLGVEGERYTTVYKPGNAPSTSGLFGETEADVKAKYDETGEFLIWDASRNQELKKF